MLRLALLAFMAAIGCSCCAPLKADGPTLPLPPAPADAKLNNPWPADWESGFVERSAHALKLLRDTKIGGGTHGENEKNYYPTAMTAFLNGNRAAALKALQEIDNQTHDHAHTKGVDFYWCFTLKGQVRKYFFFGQFLDPDYKQRMYDGAKIWTAEEPLRRPHPVYGKGGKGGVWGPENKGSWVDVRNTDNLRAMRDTSVYLFAEETGNESTRQLYKQKIHEYVRMLYFVGMSEWDSPNYHGHTLAPYHNLFDFAKDPEVKSLAKAALDWLYAAAAVKYYHGGFAGPNARDYGGNVVFGTNVTHPLSLYFGDTAIADPKADRDDLYHFTSAYRPPEAVVELARKNFARPIEILATKPKYELWTPGKDTTPRFWETTFIANTYQMGSVISRGREGTETPDVLWNICPFKLLAANTRRGVDFFAVNSARPSFEAASNEGPNPLIGHASKNPGDQVAQFRNLVVWLRPADGSKFYFMIPKTAKLNEQNGIWFFEYEKTWIALRPIGLTGRSDISPTGKSADRYGEERFFTMQVPQSPQRELAGFTLEVGEPGNHGSFAAFQKDVVARGKLDVTKLNNGEASLTASTGETLQITYNRENDLPTVVRNGVVFDRDANQELYKCIAANGKIVRDGPISAGFQPGALRIEAGGKIFGSLFTHDGKVKFSNRQTQR